ncbi:MAG: aryl-sulfate sulfotransferase [Micavibrio aeruginosavorus]|uniref:Aryl-sulfate sulfotransferase n=1 Tax=Micavibrio aeruginosavorus TaxID=349221 RepID=A0A2W4ZSN3_9BACT|nr:MAG: aryl-sulfate sulfotransferase [Micavibrio aeruginosavorus]
MNDILSEKVIKRSVTIAGHSTSISLEAPFWTILQDVAKAEKRPLSALIEEIDSRRGTNLSSALRLYVLDYLLRRS